MEKNQKVNLFPYQIKQVKNFYYRDHPSDVHPDSVKYKNYWKSFLKYSIEGLWVNDEGVWVYMPPKLFFYVNYLNITLEKSRKMSFPDLRDNEWIIFTYLLCVDGFSGFEDDDDYTCNDLIKKYEDDPESMDVVELGKISSHCRNKNGDFKKYINPWYYLTKYYLLDNPKEKPLGRALYENSFKNGMILTARSIGKSLSIFVGDFIHEFLFSGVRYMEDIDYVNNRMLFGLGSAKAQQLLRSLTAAKDAYYSMPGYFKYSDPEKMPSMGPFFKKVQGSWVVGSKIEHIVKRKKGGVIDTQGSMAQTVALTKDQTTVGAGDRFRRIYIEECGFQENLIDVFGSNKDSLQSAGTRVGSCIMLGTSGDLNAIKQPKELFTNPGGYDIFSIPNYWNNPNKQIGLFIPYIYALNDYKDQNGNTLIDLAHKKALSNREKVKNESDSISYQLEIMFNPLTVDELLRPNSSTILPKQEAQDQLHLLEMYDIFKKRAQVGKLIWDPLSERGVEWKKDMTMNLKPIIETSFDDSYTMINKEGAIIIYEQPPERIPEELYWIIYDPAARSGDGESFHSVLVYKYFATGDGKTYYDTIVAEWIGRKERLDDNYMEVIKMARYFNARIFPEINVAGFVEFCIKNNYHTMLEGDAYNLEREIHGNSVIKRSYYKVGFQMNQRKKNWCLKKLRDWLLEVKEVDALSGIPLIRTMDWILSPRILNEIIEYTDDPKENFDHISSLLGLMLLIGKLDGKEPIELYNSDEIEFESDLIPLVNYTNTKIHEGNGRCKFLQY